MQDPVEDDPLQLCVIPIVLTLDTVRIVFANCSMATSGARLHAKAVRCALLACSRSLRVVPSRSVGARLFECATRMSMAAVVREALCVYVERCSGTVGLQSAKKVSEVRCEHKGKRCGDDLCDTS